MQDSMNGLWAAFDNESIIEELEYQLVAEDENTNANAMSGGGGGGGGGGGR